jgi:hypothetical protein
MIALLMPLIAAAPHIITGIEALFGHGSGAQKKSAAMAVMGDLGNALAQDKGVPGANSALMSYLDDVIEATVKYMNNSGQFTHTIKAGN